MANELTVESLRERIKKLIDDRISYFAPSLTMNSYGDETAYYTGRKIATFIDTNNNDIYDSEDTWATYGSTED